LIRTVEEEEEFQHNKRERKAKWQAESREIKRIMIKKDCQSSSSTNEICSNIRQSSVNFSKNIVVDHASSNSLMKVVYPTNETATVSQAISTSNILSIITDINKVTVINNSVNLFNDEIEIIQNVQNSIMETSLNNIIFPIPSTPNNKLLNLDDNTLEDLIYFR